MVHPEWNDQVSEESASVSLHPAEWGVEEQLLWKLRILSQSDERNDRDLLSLSPLIGDNIILGERERTERSGAELQPKFSSQIVFLLGSFILLAKSCGRCKGSHPSGAVTARTPHLRPVDYEGLVRYVNIFDNLHGCFGWTFGKRNAN